MYGKAESIIRIMCGQDWLCTMAPGCGTIYYGTFYYGTFYYGTFYCGTFYCGTIYYGTIYYGTIAFDPSPSVIFIVSKSHYIPLIY
jgi:hypothetical protein